jgi:molecular chaperone GrpE
MSKPERQELRERAAAVLRTAAAERRQAQRAEEQAAGELARMVLAAVEGLEALTDAVDGVQDELPAPVRELLALSARAAWERLEGAGVTLDGRVGEAVDLARHRVAKTVPAGGAAAGTVAAVVTPGVTFNGRRMRDALVWVAGEKG